jgi:hypothetical protein
MEQHGWHFCFIGGLAVQAWSEAETLGANLQPLSSPAPE